MTDTVNGIDMRDGETERLSLLRWRREHAAGLAEVHVVVGAAGDDVAAFAEQAGGVVVEAPDWGEGMGASLRRGLEALDHTAARAALVMLVDLPDVGTDVHERVLAAASDAAGVDLHALSAVCPPTARRLSPSCPSSKSP